VTLIMFHVEGGVSRNQDGEMREAFREFFAELDRSVRSNGNSIRFVPFGPRRKAYDSFCAALKSEPEAYHVLLVDSEDTVKRWGECWKHLRERDGWVRPGGAEDAQCHLMAQAVEAWLFADPDTLRGYYGQGFQASSLPNRRHVEEVPKSQHLPALEAATRHSQKGLYHKTRHLPDLLGNIDAAKVRQRAWHCDQIFVTLSAKFGEATAPLCTLRPEP